MPSAGPSQFCGVVQAHTRRRGPCSPYHAPRAPDRGALICSLSTNALSLLYLSQTGRKIPLSIRKSPTLIKMSQIGSGLESSSRSGRKYREMEAWQVSGTPAAPWPTGIQALHTSEFQRAGRRLRRTHVSELATGGEVDVTREGSSLVTRRSSCHRDIELRTCK